MLNGKKGLSLKPKIPERNVYEFLNYVDRFCPDPPVVVELGARDCTETAAMAHHLPHAQIYAFECNPQTLSDCRDTCRLFKNANLVEMAVTNVNGEIPFFAIDPERTETSWEDGNPGASSLLKASGKYPIEKYVQKKIKVKATRLDTFMKSRKIKKIDALWMDIQGAELMALEGLGSEIENISLIHTETEFLEIYKNQPLFNDVYEFLSKNGFLLLGFTTFSPFSADAVFLNSAAVSSPVARLKLKSNEKKQLRKIRENAPK